VISAPKLSYASILLSIITCIPGCKVAPPAGEHTSAPAELIELEQTPNTRSQSVDLQTLVKGIPASLPSSALSDQIKESVQDHPDLLQRIRDGYQLNLENLPVSVLDQRDWHLKNPKYISTVLSRAKPFIHYVTEQLSSAGLPLEIVLLPIVESTYDAFAYSPSHAAGLWQFIPMTARRFGIDRNRWYDGRRDVVASTAAAIAYLSYLHQRFDNDWLLALAAYNSGEGTVGKAIRANIKKGKPTDFWNLKLPKETLNYVPKLLALAVIIRDADTLNVSLPEIKDEAYFDIIQIEKQISLPKVRDITDTDDWLFRKLNAGYRRSITPPEGAYQILIPSEKSALLSTFITTTDTKNWIPYTEYVVVSGDTLSEIAMRFDTQPETVKNSNNLVNDRLNIGQLLIIPKEDGDATTEKIGRYEIINHKVVAGDSLSALADQYDSSVSELRSLNALRGEFIKVGQLLDIRIPTQSIKASSLRKLSYKVRRGDSLYVIAKTFSLSISDITQWNSINREKFLQPGQRLTLYINPRSI
jgi:membrane-bound lytic murein transglycosylase D